MMLTTGDDARKMRWTMASKCPFSSQRGQGRAGQGRAGPHRRGWRVPRKTWTAALQIRQPHSSGSFGSSTCFREGILITSDRGGGLSFLAYADDMDEPACTLKLT